METELNSLYNVLKVYKESLIKILNKIDCNISQAVNNYHNAHTKIAHDKKYKISMEMVEILQSYVKMLFTSEKIAEELLTKISELDRDCEPERDIPSSSLNPFDPSNLDSASASSNFQLFSDTFREKNNQSSESILESETETVVNEPQEKLEKQRLEHIKEDPDTDLPNSSNSSDCTSDSAEITDNPEIVDVCSVKIENTHEQVNTERVKQEKPSRQVTFNIPEKTETVKVEEKKSLDAVEKLLRMPHYDWRAEARKLFENKNLRKTFKWVSAGVSGSGSSNSENEKKVKEKYAVFEIVDDELCVHQSCIFSHIESPSEFYLRTDQELFEGLEVALNEDMNNSHHLVINKYKSKTQAKAWLGNFCLGFFSTRRKWVRLQVLNWMDDDPENIFVQLVDYGDTFYWSYRNLKALTELYSMFPKMAIRCHFAGIYSPRTSKWPKNSCYFLNEISEMKKMTKFITIFVHMEGNSYAVDLRKESDPNSDTLGQILVEKGYACEFTISESDNLSELDIEEFDTLNEAITGYDARDEARLCPFTDRSGKCFKGARCKLEHGQLSADGLTTDKILTTNQALTQLVLPPNGEVVEILITGYITTCRFYGQILQRNRTAKNANDEFQTLEETMAANNIVQTYSPFKINPGVGELVLVKNGMKWCRASCVGYKENDQIEVFLVDFGNKITKKFKDLRIMKEDFLYVPFQAVECILTDCQEKKGVRDLSTQFFDNCMSMKVFNAQVVESATPLRVQMWDHSSMEMGYVLKQAGLGEDRDKDLYPSKNCILSCE